MNRADRWLGSVRPPTGNTEVRGYDTARTISDRPSVIVVSRLVDGVTVQLPPQTVRLEPVQNIRESNEQRDPVVTSSKQYVVVMGYKDHPTIPDTDLKRADLFFYQERIFEVVEFIQTVPGRLLASASLRP